MTSVRPLGDRVIVERDDATDPRERGALYVPDSERLGVIGTVVAVGPGAPFRRKRVGKDASGSDGNWEYKKVPVKTPEGWADVVRPEVKVGDRVLLDKFAGTQWRTVKIDGRKYQLIHACEILAVIEGDEAHIREVA